MVLIHLRVHYKYQMGSQFVTDDSVDIINWLNQFDKVVYAKEEIANRKHIHAVVDFNKTLSTFRQRFKKQFPMYEGNTDYSTAEVRDVDKMLSYVTKEGNAIFKGYTEEEINAVKPWLVKTEFKKQEVKSKSGNCNKAIAEELQNKYPNRVWSYSPDTMEIIVSKIQVVYGAGFKQISAHKVRDNALGILNALNTGCLHNKLMNEAFPDLFCTGFVEE